MRRGMLIGGGSVPVKSKTISVTGAEDVLSYDTENKTIHIQTLNLLKISPLFLHDANM